MRPEHWTAGDVSKLDDITEEGRILLMDVLEDAYATGLTEETNIALDQLQEVLGAEGHEFT